MVGRRVARLVLAYGHDHTPLRGGRHAPAAAGTACVAGVCCPYTTGLDDGDASGMCVAPVAHRGGCRGLRRRGHETLWERKAPDKRPGIELVASKFYADGKLALKWKAQAHGPTDADIWVRWSRDGRDWRMLALGLRGEGRNLFLPPLDRRNHVLTLIARDRYGKTRKTRRFEAR